MDSWGPTLLSRYTLFILLLTHFADGEIKGNQTKVKIKALGNSLGGTGFGDMGNLLILITLLLLYIIVSHNHVMSSPFEMVKSIILPKDIFSGFIETESVNIGVLMNLCFNIIITYGLHCSKVLEHCGEQIYDSYLGWAFVFCWLNNTHKSRER